MIGFMSVYGVFVYLGFMALRVQGLGLEGFGLSVGFRIELFCAGLQAS